LSSRRADGSWERGPSGFIRLFSPPEGAKEKEAMNPTKKTKTLKKKKGDDYYNEIRPPPAGRFPVVACR